MVTWGAPRPDQPVAGAPPHGNKFGWFASLSAGADSPGRSWILQRQKGDKMNGKLKVLMVDDSPMMHGAVKSRLLAEGLEFNSAFAGEEGLRLAQSINPDVILLDVEMPAPNGFEVCRRLKEDPALSNIPVIFLTGINSTEEKVRGLNLGAIDYVTKPFDAAELQARIRSAIRNKDLLDLLSRKALIDGLTGLHNRGFLDQRLNEELATALRHNRPLTCIMLDVDHFKSINDTHGHGFGDIVLRGIADILQKLARVEDIVCRYGGEEFAILSRETHANAGLVLANRLRKGVAESPFIRGSISVSVTCSFGVAGSLDGGADLIDRADRALYESKKNGRNRATLALPLVTIQ
jgi:two-component system cell cycle response regulator